MTIFITVFDFAKAIFALLLWARFYAICVHWFFLESIVVALSSLVVGNV